MTDQKPPDDVMSDIELPDLPERSGWAPALKGDIYVADKMREFATAAILADREKRAQAAQPVAYLDIGSGGYVDLGSDLTPEQLQALPYGRHVLAIVGTFGVDGYVAATEASKPVQAEAPHVTVRLPGITAKQAAAVSIALCEALVDAGREFGIVLIGEQAEAPNLDEYVGWYCSHCQRGVDGSEVTFREQHTECGRVITNDRPPPANKHAEAPEPDSLLPDSIWLNDMGTSQNLSFAPREGACEHHEYRRAVPPATKQTEAPHSDLMKFYGVDNLSALVEAQHRHIEKLQTKLPRDDQPAFTRVREG